MLDRELTEIELLMQQVASEAQRHEERRAQAEERVGALETEPRSDPAAIAEARGQLLSQTRRQTMMQGQTEVLAGKQRALQRFQKRLEEILPVLSDIAGEATADGGGSAGNGRTPAAGTSSSREVLAAQEQMRREIARQMHDGPAQSIANIALQAQVVQRLFARDPTQAQAELGQLVQMVQHALEATKNFIFNVRPMVLDDLGLVPTLRRTASERTRLSGVPVAFESVGADRRLSTEIESGLFRIVDDAVLGLLDARPAEILVRLDWQENALRVAVRGRASGKSDAPADKARAAVASARRDRMVPAALASMIHDQETVAGRGLAMAVWTDISQRAESLAIDVSLSNDGWKFEAAVTQRP
jgi:two-component system, NarL family, sensor histidine kinase DegS